MNDMESIVCPKCGVKMENGWVASFKRLRWLDQAEKDAPTVKNASNLQDGSGFSLKGWIYLPAFRCQACKLCVVDYSKGS